MNASRIDRMRLLKALDELLDLDEAECAAALGRVTDVEFRNELQRRLQHADGPNVLDRALPIDAMLDTPSVRNGTSDSSSLPNDFGAYQFARHLGDGGMAQVYLARRSVGEVSPGRHVRQVTQLVAFKQLRPELWTASMATRFVGEQQILARLEHPNIARMIDAGINEQRQPYLAMEYIEGAPLLAYADKMRLDVRARLNLFKQLCSAVQYAHQNLIVHRDIKPSNILIDQRGQVKLLDFGISRLLDPDASGVETQSRWQAFTPDYAAPEQIRGARTTTAMDVFSLGVVLYELLCGRHPRRLGQRQHISLLGPSDAITIEPKAGIKQTAIELSHARASDPTRLRRTLVGDLDAIVLKAIDEEPNARYPSVAELLDDIENYLCDRPTRARVAQRGYRLRKWLRRHRSAVAITLVALLGVLFGLANAWREQVRTQNALQLAQQSLARAQAVLGFTGTLFQGAQPIGDSATKLSAEQLLIQSAGQVQKNVQLDPLVRADLSEMIGRNLVLIELRDQGLAMLELALQLRRQFAPNESAALARSLALFAYAKSGVAEPTSVIPLLDEALALSAGLPIEGRALALQFKADVLSRSNPDPKAQLEMCESALDIWRQLKVSDERFFTALNGKAFAQNALGNSTGAIETLRQMIQSADALYGANNITSAMNYGNLASLHERRGYWQEAKKNLEQGIRILDVVMPYADEIKTVQRRDLGKILRSLGDLPASVSMLSSARTDAKNARHPDPYVWERINTRYWESSTALNPALARQALVAIRSSIEYLAKNKGAAHHSTRTAQIQLAAVHRYLGDLNTAREVLQDVLAHSQSEADQPERLEALEQLALVEYAAANMAPAAQLLQAAIKLSTTRVGIAHPASAKLEWRYAQVLRAMGKVTDANRIVERITPILRRENIDMEFMR
jgi:eukaryotic-like serine/threonine-protein kinase